MGETEKKEIDLDGFNKILTGEIFFLDHSTSQDLYEKWFWQIGFIKSVYGSNVNLKFLKLFTMNLR